MPPRNQLGPDNRLFPDSGPSLADAWSYNANAYGDWLAQQRASGVQAGMIDPATGWPTGNALLDAARQYSGALIAGTSAPGIRAFHGSPHSFDKFDLGRAGTGEGNIEAHGLFVTSDRALADHYQTYGVPGAKPGVTYETSVQADPKAMIDFNASMSEQPKAARSVIEPLVADYFRTTSGNSDAINPAAMPAKTAYAIAAKHIGSHEDLAAALQQAGVPGITYTDRGTPLGDPATNHIIFDPQSVGIVRRFEGAGTDPSQ